MRVRKVGKNKYFVHTDDDREKRLSFLSTMYANGDNSVMLHEVIKDGFEITESIYRLLSDNKFILASLKKQNEIAKQVQTR